MDSVDLLGCELLKVGKAISRVPDWGYSNYAFLNLRKCINKEMDVTLISEIITHIKISQKL